MIAVSKVSTATREVVDDLEERFGRKRVYLFGGAALFLVLLLLIRFATGVHKKTPPPPPRPVSVAKAIARDVPLYLDEIGTCAANESVQVQAQVSGQIIERHFQDGADVRKGDLLFTIDPRPYQAMLDQAKGQLAQAKAQLALDQLNWRRQQELWAKKVSSAQEADTAQATVATDEARVQSAEAAVSAAQVNLDFTNIRSPIDGRIGLRQVDVGNTVSAGMNGGAGGAVLVNIDNLDPIYTDFTIAEPDIPLVRRYLNGPNLKVLTDAEGDNYPPREGKLYFIANTVQAGTGTVQARAVTPNPDRALWPSQFVHVRLVLDILKSATLVPNNAVQIGQNGPYVFVVKADATLDLRQVEPGQKQGELTVIKKGVGPGEEVVTRGQLQLAPGMKVAVQQTEPTVPNEKKNGESESSSAL
jgi:multidrug efflux system membrane fusion protein